MSHQAMRRRGATLRANPQAKEANLKRPHAVWFHLHDVLEEAKRWRQESDQWAESRIQSQPDRETCPRDSPTTRGKWHERLFIRISLCIATPPFRSPLRLGNPCPINTEALPPLAASGSLQKPQEAGPARSLSPFPGHPGPACGRHEASLLAAAASVPSLLLPAPSESQKSCLSSPRAAWNKNWIPDVAPDPVSSFVWTARTTEAGPGLETPRELTPGIADGLSGPWPAETSWATCLRNQASGLWSRSSPI